MTRQDLSLDPLARALEAEDPEERRQAVASLSEMDAAEAMPLLVRGLGDVDWRVRKEATESARAFVTDRRLVETLVPLLGTEEDIGFRNAAVEVLTATGALATPLVTEALGMLDADGRKLAVDILGGSRDPSALAALALARHDPDPNVRHSAIEAIAMLGALSREPVEGILLRCLDDSETVVRLTALGGLNALGVAIPWERIETLLRDPTLRTTALAAAAFSDSPQAPPVVASALNEARPTVFSQALRTLAQISESHPPRTSKRVAIAVAPLPLAVHDRIVRSARGELSEPIELRAAALVVGAVAGADGIREVALDALLDTQLEPAAHRALMHLGMSALPALIERLGGGSMGPPSSGGTEAFEADSAIAMLEVIAAIAHSARPRADEVAALPGLFDVLRAMIRSPSSGTATSALFALGRLGTAEDLETVADLASAGVAPIAHAARGTLSAIARREPHAAVVLARALAAKDPISIVVTAIIGALSVRREPTLADRVADLDYLARALRDGDSRTRKVAVTAVAELGGAEAFDLLSLALSDETREVQLAAAHALGRLSAGPSSGRQASIPPPRASAVIELVSRSNDESLVAAAVDSLGDPRARKPMSIPPGSIPPPSSSASDELVAALGALVAVSASAVAIAAVDALGRLSPSSPGRKAALAGALTHAEPDVARVALMKLESSPDGARAIASSLRHASSEVRLLAAEILGRVGTASISSELEDLAKTENDAAVRGAIAKTIALIAGRGAGAQST